MSDPLDAKLRISVDDQATDASQQIFENIISQAEGLGDSIGMLTGEMDSLNESFDTGSDSIGSYSSDLSHLISNFKNFISLGQSLAGSSWFKALFGARGAGAATGTASGVAVAGGLMARGVIDFGTDWINDSTKAKSGAEHATLAKHFNEYYAGVAEVIGEERAKALREDAFSRYGHIENGAQEAFRQAANQEIASFLAAEEERKAGMKSAADKAAAARRAEAAEFISARNEQWKSIATGRDPENLVAYEIGLRERNLSESSIASLMQVEKDRWKKLRSDLMFDLLADDFEVRWADKQRGSNELFDMLVDGFGFNAKPDRPIIPNTDLFTSPGGNLYESRFATRGPGDQTTQIDLLRKLVSELTNGNHSQRLEAAELQRKIDALKNSGVPLLPSQGV